MSEEAKTKVAQEQAKEKPKQIDDKSMAELIKGIRQRLPISEYANKGFSAEQMKQIRLGMKKGISYQLYAAPYISPNAMKQWRKMLENGMEDKSIIDYLAADGRSYDSEQIKQIRQGMKDKIDVKLFANPDYNAEQMKQIRLGVKNGIDYSIYANNSYSAEQMKMLRIEMLVAKIIDFIKQKFAEIYISMKAFAQKHISIDSTQTANENAEEKIMTPDETENAKLFTLMKRAYDKMVEKNESFEELSFDEKVDSIMKEFERAEKSKANSEQQESISEEEEMEI